MKLKIRKQYIITTLVGAFLSITLCSYPYGPGAGGAGDRTGASGTAGCGGSGTTCHGSAVTSTTTISLQLLDGGSPVTSYVASHAYTIHIVGTNTGSLSLPRFGFQVSAVATGTSTNLGTLSATGITGVAHLGTYSSVACVENSHEITTPYVSGSGGTGTTYTIDVPWTSPSTSGSCLTIYCALNAINYNYTNDAGDKYNYTSLAISGSGTISGITGTPTMCVGGTTTLSDATAGGAWSSGATGVATVSGTAGACTVTGVSAGTAVITYATSCGSTTTTVTVNPLPSPISGTLSVCVGSAITLTDPSPGGTWTSVSSGVASIAGSGTTATVTGLTTGTSVISYTNSSGCAKTATVTVNPLPTISGTLSVCALSTTALSGSPSGGTWSISSTGLATVGSSSGLVTGVAAGNPVITYTSPSGCVRTAILTVNFIPSAITGTMTVCQGATTALADPTTGGTWSSTSPSIATIGTSGIVAGGSGGTALISYTLPTTGCAATATVTVHPSPTPIAPSPTFAICPGATESLSDGSSGGTWTSSATGVATVGTSGIVFAVATGTATITYTLPVTGCYTTAAATVFPMPAPITGTLSLCVGSSDTLHDGIVGSGAWSSGTTAFATIDPSSGVLTGVSGPGTSLITYTDLSTFCTRTALATVNALPTIGLIGTTLNICPGTCTTLNCTPAGGTWTSLSTSVATVGSTSGIACGGVAGNATIVYSYTDANGCINSTNGTLTTNATPASISGPSSVCTGSTTTYTASPGGSWSSSNTSVATVGVSSGTVSAIATGTAVLTYTASTGCYSTKAITVNIVPTTITGSSTICNSSSVTYSSAPAGGTWTSSSPAVISIGSSSGTATGITNSTAIITYTVAGGCFATKPLTVSLLPAVIGGTASVCAGATTNLTDATTGGIWSSSTTGTATVGSTGIVSGVAGGTAIITYAVPTTGCYVVRTVTVNAVPVVAPITGIATVCVGQTTTLASTTTTGTWSTSNPSVATAGSSSGLITGITAGTATITYTVTNGSGCSAFVTTPVTVNAAPSTVGGLSAVCTGASISLSDATPGGSWSASNANISIGSTGIATGITAGTVVASYTLLSGCYAIKPLTVSATPGAISGAATVCAGQSVTLTNSTSGGMWTSSNTALASAGSSSGLISGVAAGTPVISYTMPGGCFATRTETVNALSPITGASSSCAGATTALSDATPGGSWSSTTTGVATIATSGLVSAVTTGTTVISYLLPSGCVATTTFTVISTPSPISGSGRVCVGTTTPLTDLGGGTWSSSSPAVASVGSLSGIVSGVIPGTATITYSLGSGCTVSLPVTVNALPSAITGATTVCTGANTTLSDASPGGTWSTAGSNASVGSSTGIVTGITSGPAVITYTSAVGCNVTKNLTVNAAPAAITGMTSVCTGATTPLGDATPSGSWTSGATGIATVVSTTGLVTGIGAGTATITYTVGSTGCYITTPVTVNPIPAAITGTLNVCIGATTTLSDATTGGSWSAPGPGISVGSSTGTVTGISTGPSVVSYALPTGCVRTTSVTVNALPVVAAITGAPTVCAGFSVTLGDATTGGRWSSSDLSVATIGSTTGAMSGVSAGTATITYTVVSGAGCAAFATTPVTVHPAPAAITGASSACAGAGATLSDATSGGTWSSTPTTVATIGTAGDVSGISAGTAAITYTAGGCFTTYGFTVNPLPPAPTGTLHVCAGLSTTLTDSIPGGTWVSGFTSVATVGSSSGVVTGVMAGTDTISYTLPTGCTVSTPFTVNPLPVSGVVTGPASVCVGATIPLTDTLAGGIWASSNPSLASVGSTGIVTGIAAGTDTILYTITNICGSSSAFHIVTVNPLADAGSISGAALVCVGTPATFTDAAPGGNWASSNTGIATVGSGSGVVSGIATGSVTISYSVTNVCNTAVATIPVTVDALPSAGTINGSDSMCEGDTISLIDGVPGGVWSAGNTNVTVGSTGVVTGVSAGVSEVSYTVTNPCGSSSTTKTILVRSHAACNVGVKPMTHAYEVRIYPNPSAGSFTVELPATTDPALIRIVDMLGKTIETRVVPGNAARSAIFELKVAAGSYFVDIRTGEQVHRGKVTVW